MSDPEPPFPDPAGFLAAIPAEVLEHDCGCGSAWRWAREGETVLDLGCGSGKTCFLLSRVVGPSGHVIGLDASAAMLGVARRHQDAVARAIGWSNLRFVESRIEDLGRGGTAGPLVADASVDLVVLDCVLTFVQARARGSILDQAARVLRSGGRLLVSDILRGDREGVPEALAGAGLEGIVVLERSEEVSLVIDDAPRFATMILAYRPFRGQRPGQPGRGAAPHLPG